MDREESQPGAPGSASPRGSVVASGGDLPYAPATWSQRARLIVSIRVPWAKGRTAAAGPLFTDLSTLTLSKKQLPKVAERAQFRTRHTGSKSISRSSPQPGRVGGA